MKRLLFDQILRSGHRFSPHEHFLEYRTMFLNSLLLLGLFSTAALGVLYQVFLNEYTIALLVYAMGLLSIAIFLLLRLGKNYYRVSAHFLITALIFMMGLAFLLSPVPHHPLVYSALIILISFPLTGLIPGLLYSLFFIALQSLVYFAFVPSLPFITFLFYILLLFLTTIISYFVHWKMKKDIYALDRQKKELEKERAHLHTAQKIARLGIWELDPVSQTYWLSEQMQRIIGFEPVHRQYALEEVFQLFPAEKIPEIKQTIEQAMQDMQPKEFSTELTRPDGVERIVYIHGRAVEEADGKIKIVGVTQDVTEQKATEYKLKELNEQLSQQVQQQVEDIRQKDYILIQQGKMATMGEMISAIAHQWRQPLTIVNLVIQDIQDAYAFDDLTREGLAENANIAEDQLKFMSRTIDDFRDFVKPDQRSSEFFLATAIQTVISLIHARMKYHMIELVFHAENKELQHTGLPNEFKQVLLSLLNNALESILRARQKGLLEDDAGMIRIELRSDEQKKRISIRDNGEGIADEITGRIFDPYFTTSESGTGIGLYMARAIIEKRLQGTLHLEDHTGGATFVIELPVD